MHHHRASVTAGAEALATALRGATALASLQLSNNYIGRVGGKALADTITSNGALRLMPIERT